MPAARAKDDACFRACAKSMHKYNECESREESTHSDTAPTLRRCWVPNSRDRQRCRACVLDTRLSAYNGHVGYARRGWGLCP